MIRIIINTDFLKYLIYAVQLDKILRNLVNFVLLPKAFILHLAVIHHLFPYLSSSGIWIDQIIVLFFSQ